MPEESPRRHDHPCADGDRRTAGPAPCLRGHADVLCPPRQRLGRAPRQPVPRSKSGPRGSIPAVPALRMGIPFGLHVDSPVQPVDAIRSIHTAVNRTTTAGRILGPDQRISPLDALKAYTVNAAKCSARDHAVGHHRSRILCGFCAAFRKSADRAARVHRNAFRAQDHLRRAHRLRILRSSPRLPAVHAKAGSLFSPVPRLPRFAVLGMFFMSLIVHVLL